MYDVSSAFLEATKQKTRVSKIRGTITTKSGNVIDFDDANLVKGSLSIDNQCVNGSNFEFGAVYQGQLTFSLLENVNRYTLYDAEISLSYSLQLADNTFEEVPLGVFYIAEPNRTRKILAIKAYDGMQKLDKAIESEVFGSVWDLLSHTAEVCGVELAQTQEEIEALINASAEFVYTFIPERVSTYRDALAYLAMVTATFGTFDRFGRLKLVQYGVDNVDTFSENERSTSTISDFETYFSGVEARFLAEENFAPYENYVEGSGLVLDLGDIPIVQGLPEMKHTILENIMGVLLNIRYVPCNINLAGGNPAIDLGDMITNRHGNVETCSLVTRYVWKYRQAQTLESAGSNPRLAGAKSKTDKQFSSAESNMYNRDVVVHSFVNASDLSFQSNERDIIRMTYASNVENCKPILIATIQLTMSLDGYVVFRFYLDGVLENNFTVRKYLERGEHFVTCMFHSVLGKSGRAKLVITGQTEYFESDFRLQEANILTNNNAITAISDYLNTPADTGTEVITETEETTDTPNVSWDAVEVDITVPTCTIHKNRANAILFGQGLASTVPWDGTFTFAETVGKITLESLVVKALTDNNEPEPLNPTRTVFAEIIERIALNSMGVRALVESVETEAT